VDRPHLIRRLRIAVSVFFTLIVVALCALWVRSYSIVDSWDVRTATALYRVESQTGRIWMQAIDGRGRYGQELLDELSRGSFHFSYEMNPGLEQAVEKGWLGFALFRSGNTKRLGIPHWFTACLAAGIAGAP